MLFFTLAMVVLAGLQVMSSMSDTPVASIPKFWTDEPSNGAYPAAKLA
jgi:hypothetical protein